MKNTHKLASILATLMTFGSLASAVDGAVITFGNADRFDASPYSEGAFTITATSTNAILLGASFGSHYFTYDGPSGIAILTMASGASFDLASLDIGLGQLAGDTSTNVTLVGTLFGGGTVTTTISDVTTVQNVAIGWTDLISVAISGTDDPGIDNINVTATVPEVSSVLIFGLGVFGLLGRRRRLS